LNGTRFVVVGEKGKVECVIMSPTLMAEYVDLCGCLTPGRLVHWSSSSVVKDKEEG